MTRITVCLLILTFTWAFAAEKPGFSPKSLAYVLQVDRLAEDRTEAVRKLAGCERDVIVVDLAFNSEPGGLWTREEVDRIRRGKAERKVVAYLSIGEAEDYRPYWQKSWDADHDGKPDASAPKFLDVENPDWKGNYRVRYWQPEWQKIMLPFVDKVAAQGFDGVYLDIVDAFEFYEYDQATKDWQDNRLNPETSHTYRQDMIAWVGAIAKRARAQNPGFLVIPQNAATLLEQGSYREVISAIGVEDLFIHGRKLKTEKQMSYVLGFLEKLKAHGKPIFAIDYPAAEGIRAAAFERARKQGYVLLLTDRELTTLGESR